jgi:hypothetical protein
MSAGEILAARQARRRRRIVRQTQLAGGAGGDFHSAVIAPEHACESPRAGSIQNLPDSAFGVVEVEVQTLVDFSRQRVFPARGEQHLQAHLPGGSEVRRYTVAAGLGDEQ